MPQVYLVGVETEYYKMAVDCFTITYTFICLHDIQVYDQHDQAAMIVKHWNGCAECYAGVSNYSINCEYDVRFNK